MLLVLVVLIVGTIHSVGCAGCADYVHMTDYDRLKQRMLCQCVDNVYWKGYRNFGVVTFSIS